MTTSQRIARSAIGVALVAAGLGVVVAAPASAAVPGANGNIVYASYDGVDADLVLMKPNGAAKIPRTNSAHSEGDPVLSPNGAKIAFSQNTGAGYDIFVMNANGSGTPVNLTNSNGSNEQQPSWSPDGTRLLLISNKDGGDQDIYSMPAGGGAMTPLTAAAGDEWGPSLSPDAKRLAYVKSGEVVIANSDGSNPQNFTTGANAQTSTPDFSPDGRRLAFVGGGTGDVFVGTIAGTGTAVNVTNNPAHDTDPAFSPDGTKIVFSSNRGTDLDIYVSAVAASAPATDLSNDTTTGPDDYEPHWGSVQDPNCRIVPGFNVILGTAGNDTITGTNGRDLILGFGGNDTISGGASRDIICGGSGHDRVFGRSGSDRLIGGGGNDLLVGGNGADVLHGEDGNDVLRGGKGRDSLYGESGRDILRGGKGSDRVRGGAGRDDVAQ